MAASARRGRAFAELDLFNAALAVHETGLHLDLLVARGQAAGEQMEGVATFSPRAPAAIVGAQRQGSATGR